MTLAEKCVDYRARQKISQDEFARRLGYSRQTVINVEAGRGVLKTTEARIRAFIDG